MYKLNEEWQKSLKKFTPTLKSPSDGSQNFLQGRR